MAHTRDRHLPRLPTPLKKMAPSIFAHASTAKKARSATVAIRHYKLTDRVRGVGGLRGRSALSPIADIVSSLGRLIGPLGK
jgi:hypothetical protein